MIASLRAMLLRLLRVPPEPHLPAGSAGSVRVFRASKRFYTLCLLRWGFGQAMTAIGVIFAIVMLSGVVEVELAALEGFDENGSLLWLLRAIELLGVLGFLAQLPVTLFMVRLDYEMRWYIVTDRSLRIREGVWRINELTLTFANVQEVSIRQGPLQRLLDIADLRVRTAGGGGATAGKKGGNSEEDDSHVGYFRGVDDVRGIRDLVVERLKRLRDAGLGDPDQHDDEAVQGAPTVESELLDACRELLTEARALRSVA